MRRLLIISPHFPPDTSAGTHRARLIAAHLLECGWEPTVLTVDPSGYETRLDEGLLSLVPRDLQVVRSVAWSPERARRLGIGDLGLRSMNSLSRDAAGLLASGSFDAVYVTTYPVYPALIGPRLKRRFGLPFVLDLQDPWVGSWGKTVGSGNGGRPDLKSRCSRAAAWALESWVAPRADAITAVSRGTFDELASRHPRVRKTPFLELPIGADAADLSAAARSGVNRWFRPDGHLVHICSVGTILPRGGGVLDAVFKAVARIRAEHPALFARLRLHFVGTSNQTNSDARPRVVPVAERHGVVEAVDEAPARADYLDALTIQRDADALLLLGSDEPHYTASKVYPALIVERPIIAVYHRASTVVDVLKNAGSTPPVSIITFDEGGLVEDHVRRIAAALVAAGDRAGAVTASGMATRSLVAGAPQVDRLGAAAAPRLAARLAAFLESLPAVALGIRNQEQHPAPGTRHPAPGTRHPAPRS
jgi:glycosyltransferase involved in cell wall biosynthesis